MRRVEETVTGVCSASASELVVREAKCNKTEICVTRERPGEALRN
jgi:hypothetical protein